MAEGQVTDRNPIVNDPYAAPVCHWRFGDGVPELVDGRRPSGYLPGSDTKSGELSVVRAKAEAREVIDAAMSVTPRA